MRALAERRRERRIERLPEIAPVDMAIAERLESLQPELAKPLTLEDDPVVVPVRQQIAGELVDLPRGHASVELAAREHLGLSEVDGDRGTEPERRASRFEQPVDALLDAPQRRAQIRSRTLVGRVEPEHARDVVALERTIVQCEERDDALCAHREIHRTAVVENGEAAQ